NKRHASSSSPPRNQTRAPASGKLQTPALTKPTAESHGDGAQCLLFLVAKPDDCHAWSHRPEVRLAAGLQAKHHSAAFPERRELRPTREWIRLVVAARRHVA